MHKGPLKLHFEKPDGQSSHFLLAIWMKYDQGENLVGKGEKRQMPRIKQKESVNNDRTDKEENEVQSFGLFWIKMRF